MELITDNTRPMILSVSPAVVLKLSLFLAFNTIPIIPSTQPLIAINNPHGIDNIPKTKPAV